MQRNRVILFDLDGTLIDSTDAILESFNVALMAFGIEFDRDKIKGLIGYPLDIMFERLGVREEQIDFAIKNYKEYYKKIFKIKTSLLVGAKEALEMAYLNAYLGVVTTKTGSYSKELLNYLLVGKYFSVVIGREDVENPKPHPEPILKAMSYFKNLNSDAFFMVGDTTMDIEAALSAGITPVGVSCGYQLKDMLIAMGVKVCSNSLEAVKWIINQ